MTFGQLRWRMRRIEILAAKLGLGVTSWESVREWDTIGGHTRLEVRMIDVPKGRRRKRRAAPARTARRARS